MLQAEVALLVRSAGTESDADEGGPRSPLEQEDGEDDTESETEGRLDEEVGEAAVPLKSRESVSNRHPRHGAPTECHATFSLSSASLTGREMALGGGVAAVSDMAGVCCVERISVGLYLGGQGIQATHWCGRIGVREHELGATSSFNPGDVKLHEKQSANCSGYPKAVRAPVPFSDWASGRIWEILVQRLQNRGACRALSS